MPPYFAFGTDMVDADGEPASLVDHMWMWTDAGRAVAVPLAGRTIHGILVDGRSGGSDSSAGFDAAPGSGAATEPVRREDSGVVVPVDRDPLSVVGVATADGSSVPALALVEHDPDPGPPSPAVLDIVIAAARGAGLPAEWLDYLTAWRRAGRRVPDAGSTAGAPASLAELLEVPGVVEESALRSPFGFMAIHGGSLEAMTDGVARRAAEAAGASYYGVLYPDTIDVHLSSTAYGASDSPALASFLSHVEVVVSVHGFGRVGHWRSILLGGRNRDLADHVGQHLSVALEEYDVVTDIHAIPAALRGLHERNPVNVPAGHGVQIELPPRVRGLSPLSPPKGPDGLSPPTRALVDALAAAATTWP